MTIFITKKIRKIFSAILLLIMVIAMGVPARPTYALTRNIIFPVIGSVSFRDDFGDPRAGHTHEGNDLLGVKMQPLVAAADGIVRFVTWPEADYGYLVSIEDTEGYQYWYLHINNDHPGTDDDMGGGRFAYAPDVDDGDPVVKGQLIGWMGDSGNAESTSPHLHFELHTPDGTPIDPYTSLKAATHINQPTNPPPLPNETWPFGNLRGGAHLAYGRVEAGHPDEQLITAAGPGGGPQVRIFRADGSVVTQFFAYPKTFHGGVDVAAGDVDGDGIDEIITAPGPGGGPQVKIFNALGQQQIEFYAYSPLFTNGISVAAADLDGDGKAEIITGSGPKMEPRVKVFNAQGDVLADFLAYVPQFQGGVDVAATSAAANGQATIITGAGPGGGPDVRMFDPVGTLLGNFYAYDKTFRGGVRVSIADAITDNDTEVQSVEIVTIPASRGGSQIRAFTIGGSPVFQAFAFEQWWSGGYDVAAGQGRMSVASGPTNKGPGGRRASVRNVMPSVPRFFFNSLTTQDRQRLLYQW